MSRFQDKHAGDLQAPALCRQSHEEKAARGKLPRAYKRTRITLHVRYGDEAELRLLLPDDLPREVEAVAAPLRDVPITDIADLMKRIRRLEGLGHPVHIYPDAEEMTNAILTRDRLDATVSSIRRDPRSHALRKDLLKVELLPYQLDGIAFAVGAGRALIADDMGLGKTLQGIGTAELFAREAGISRVLVVCPASVKAQWVLEIQRATERTCQIVTGPLRRKAGAVPHRRLLHHRQLRAGAQGLHLHRDGAVGPHHPGRGAEDQELAGKDGAGDQVPAVALCPHAHGDAPGEPSGRAVFGRSVHQQPTPGTRVSASSTGIVWSTRRDACWDTGTSTSSEAPCSDSSASDARHGPQAAPSAHDGDPAHRAFGGAAGTARHA